MSTQHAVCSVCGKAIYCKAYSHHWKALTNFNDQNKTHVHTPKKGTIT